MILALPAVVSDFNPPGAPVLLLLPALFSLDADPRRRAYFELSVI